MTPLRRIDLLVLSKVALKFLKQHNFMAFPSLLLHLSGTSSKKQALHMRGHKLAILLRSHPVLNKKSYAKVKNIAAFLSETLKTLLLPTSPLPRFAMSLQVKDIIAGRLERPFSSIRPTGWPARPGQSETST